MPGVAWPHFGDNLMKFGDLASFLAKNEYSRNFKSQICRSNRKRDIGEYLRNFCEIVIITHQAPK